MLKKYFNKKNEFTKGFTIIETMIAISIFLVVIVIGVGSLVNAYLVNRKSQDMRSIMDSLSFAMEDMSRHIRTGYNYQCLENNGQYTTKDLGKPTSCIEGFGIAFESSEDNDISNNYDQWVYYVSDGKLYRSTEGLESPVQMTPDAVSINSNSLKFSVIGAENHSEGDIQQPLVIIRLAGTIQSGSNTTQFSLQTAVSQRINDI